MFGGDLLGLAVGVEGVLVGLLGELMGGEVVALAVGGGGRGVSVGGEVVQFGGAVVSALRHGGSPLLLSCGWMRLGGGWVAGLGQGE